jgi:hypothetical protein
MNCNMQWMYTSSDIKFELSEKENKFTKNSAFNKSFGTGSGTVAEGNDSRINNGQTAFTSLSNYLPLVGGTMSNTSVVTNLNADLLDGLHSSAFQPSGVSFSAPSTLSTDKGNEYTWYSVANLSYNSAGQYTFYGYQTSLSFMVDIGYQSASLTLLTSRLTVNGGYSPVVGARVIFNASNQLILQIGVYTNTLLYWDSVSAFAASKSTNFLSSLVSENTSFTVKSSIILFGSLTNNYAGTDFLKLTGGTLSGNLTAPTFIGALTGNADTASSAPNAGNLNDYYTVNVGENKGIRFWTSDTYSILMGAAVSTYQYGTVNDYSLKMSMGGGAGRGFTWGQFGTKPIASLNSTSGNFQTAGTMSSIRFIGPLTGNSDTATNVAWSGITSKPTTLSGFGIIDTPWTSYLPLSGGALTGLMSVTTGDQSSSRINIKNNSSTGARTFGLVAGITNISQEGFSIFDSVASASRLVINNSGYIGMGTTTPQFNLQVVGKIAAHSFISQAGNSNYEGNRLEYDTYGSQYGWKVYTDSANVASFFNDRTLFTSNVGIATLSPTEKLEVNGNIKASGSVQVGANENVATAAMVGSTRYKSDANNSYVDIVMQTSATTYEWVNIVTNTW